MKKNFIYFMMFLLSKLPLNQIQAIGSLVGILVLKLSKRSSRRLNNNLIITGLVTRDRVNDLAKKVAKSLGMTLLESALIAWAKNHSQINKLVTADETFYQIKEKIKQGKSIIFLTPHIGNFEVALKYFAYNLPMELTILYKPSKDKVLEELMYNGRKEVNINPVPTNRRGVLALIKALNAGECIGILPDNVASGGDGEWVKFFGQNVYATTLAAKLIFSNKVEVVLVSCTREKQGFYVKCIPFVASSLNAQQVTQQIYTMIEKLINKNPEQYYWTYDRFRHPEHAKPLI